MTRYYLSRGLISILFAGLVYLLSASIWTAVISGAAIFAVFAYFPRSGRYKKFPEKGAAALQRDEWTQAISQKSARNAYVFTTIAGSLIILYYGLISPGDVPLFMLGSLIAAGAVVYFLSDIWLRRV